MCCGEAIKKYLTTTFAQLSYFGLIKECMGLVFIYALSFYKSQNVLCRSKFFEPDQKFNCI